MKPFSFKNLTLALPVLLSFTLLLASCDKSDDPVNPPVSKPDLTFFAVTASNQLMKLNANAVEGAQTTLAVTGLPAGETILGIDFRPATGELYAVTSASRLYVINTTTAAARPVGTAAFTPAISGTAVGFDFNPTVDRIRLVTSSGQNLRLHPETGAVAATDGAINGPANAMVSGAAYSGNTAGSVSTVLYDIDAASGKLYRQVPPNNGTLVEIGSLGLGTITGGGSFDISPSGSVALATLTVGSQTGLYQVDTATGKATSLGNFAAAASVTSIAIPTTPVGYAVDDMNTLLIFDISTTTTPTILSKPITGLAAGETIVGLDFRPLNGQLYALGSTSRLYTLNPSSGAALPVGAIPFATLLAGTSYGFDFNPTVDRIRIVSDAGQNLRAHPDLGTIAAVDGSLNPGSPAVSAAAYTNNFAGATSTVLFVIDHMSDKLFTQDPPNNGTLVERGALGINIEAANGFDIGSSSGKAWGIFTVGGTSSLYNVNLTSGAATKVIDLPKGARGFTVGLGF